MLWITIVQRSLSLEFCGFEPLRFTDVSFLCLERNSRSTIIWVEQNFHNNPENNMKIGRMMVWMGIFTSLDISSEIYRYVVVNFYIKLFNNTI